RWLRALGHPACGGQKSGPPWRWPYYPCSLFVYLTIGLAIRSWWLTIAFEPAKGTDTYFRPYFLLPLVLAWAVLILEMGLVRRSSGAIAAALLLPLVGLVIGFPGPGHNLVEAAFVDRLLHPVGSPPRRVVAGLLLIYGYAWIRGVNPPKDSRSLQVCWPLSLARKRSTGRRSARRIHSSWPPLPVSCLGWRF